MTEADATRLAGNTDATRRSNELDHTRVAPKQSAPATAIDFSDLTPEAYLLQLEKEMGVVRDDSDELHNIGEKIGGRYEVLAIHHGAMGVVYGCYDHETYLPRALKTVRPEYAKNESVISQFESEASVWISLEKHPNIVRAYLAARYKKRPYVITEYILGQKDMTSDLRGWIGHERMTVSVAVGIALNIAQGMQHAVRKVPNLVHRDLKPGNILVNRDGKAMVTDFGLVNIGDRDAGTPAYMSPEQWQKISLDCRSDIYSFGCILFEMFTAHRIFPAQSEKDWQVAHLETTPTSLKKINQGVPEGIDEFVIRCLSKNPNTRPQNWSDVVAFFAGWYHRLTGNAVVLDFSSLSFDKDELVAAGNSLLNVWRHEEASQAFQRALSIDPQDEHVWQLLGYSLFCSNQFKDAIFAYDKAISISPNNENIRFFRNEVVRCLEEEATFLEMSPENRRAEAAKESLRDEARKWLTVGGILMRKLKRYEEAIRAYDRATIAPDCGGAWCGKGYCYAALQRYEDAIEAFNKAISINPKNSVAWFHKGQALYDLSRYSEAISSYDMALSVKPDDEPALKGREAAIACLNDSSGVAR